MIQRLPGLVDPHVHLRVPGEEHKETIATGTAAALAGGITTVLAMPNTRPPVTDAATLARVRQRIAQEALCDVGQFLGGTGENAATVARSASAAAGLKLYVNETYGPLRIERLPALVAHFRRWPPHKPIAVHAEGVTLAAVIALSWLHERRVHVCHVSRAAEIRLIRAAKERGAPITCEVTPHHLFLTAADAQRLGPFGHVRPPLGTAQDRDALWEHLDVVDCIATDHAPHTVEEKQGAHPPPGMPGLETMLPLMLTAVHEGRLSLERLVELTHTNPTRIFGLRGQPDTFVEVELGATWVLPEHGYQTRVDWSPFAGMTVRGRVMRTVLRGTVAYEGGEIRVKPGFGTALFGTTGKGGPGEP